MLSHIGTEDIGLYHLGLSYSKWAYSRKGTRLSKWAHTGKGTRLSKWAIFTVQTWTEKIKVVILGSPENIFWPLNNFKWKYFQVVSCVLKIVWKTGSWQRSMVNDGRWWRRQVASGGRQTALAVAMVVVDRGCYYGSLVADNEGWKVDW